MLAPLELNDVAASGDLSPSREVYASRGTRRGEYGVCGSLDMRRSKGVSC